MLQYKALNEIEGRRINNNALLNNQYTHIYIY